jgi:hypothetical protein
MTVRELREKLAEQPDDAEVRVLVDGDREKLIETVWAEEQEMPGDTMAHGKPIVFLEASDWDHS